MKHEATPLLFAALPVTWPVGSHRLHVPVLALPFPGPRVSAPIEAPGTPHSMHKVSARLPRHKHRVSKNPAPRDSRPPHQSTTEGSSWPGGLAQDVHPQPRSRGTSHATHAHIGMPTDLPTLRSRHRARAGTSLLRSPFQGDAQSAQTTVLYVRHAKRTSCSQARCYLLPAVTHNGNDPHPQQSTPVRISGKTGQLGAEELHSPFSLDMLTPTVTPLPLLLPLSPL